MDNSGRKVVIQSLVGSHNRNIPCEGSDKDYVVLVNPSQDDMYQGVRFRNVIKNPELDIRVHDVRDFPTLLSKGSPNYIDVLFSKDMQCNALEFIELIQFLERKNEIARMNLRRLYNACLGIVNESTSRTCTSSGAFDRHMAVKAWSYLDFLIRYLGSNFSDYGKAIWFEGDSLKQYQKIMFDMDYKIHDFLGDLNKKYSFVCSACEKAYCLSPANTKLASELEEQVKLLVLENMEVKI